MERNSADRCRLSELLALSGADRDAALANFIESFQTYLLLLADRQLPGELRAKVAPADILQDTYLEARRDLKRFQGDNERDLLAWLRTILLNNVRDVSRQYQRHQKRQVAREVSLDDSGVRACEAPRTDSPMRVASSREEGQKLQRALRQLPRDYRRVVVLRVIERRPLAEVARTMDRSEDAARKLLARALQQLQSSIRSLDPALS